MITLLEFCQVIDRQVVIRSRSRSNLGERWYAEIEGAEVLDRKNGMLTSTFGNGATPARAIEDMIARYTGQTLVFNAWGGEKRREYPFPEVRGEL